MAITDLLAAQLSFAAYTSVDAYRHNTITINGVATPLSNTQYLDDTAAALPVLRSLPANWHVDTSISNFVGDNQFVVFRNDPTNQVVIAFKGTNTLSQGMSDVLNSGFAAWDSIRTAAQNALSAPRSHS